MAVPNQFANVPGGTKIPLEQLDQNFNYLDNQTQDLQVQVDADVDNLQYQIDSVTANVSASAAPNVTALRAITVVNNKIIELLGYNSINDGGGGLFYGVEGLSSLTFNNSPSTVAPYITTNGVGDYIFVTNGPHGLASNETIAFTTTGSLPVNIESGVNYTVVVSTSNQFRIYSKIAGRTYAGTTPGGSAVYSGVTAKFYDNGGTIFNAPGGKWVRQISEDDSGVNVLWFGAVRNTTSNDSSALADSSPAVDAALTAYYKASAVNTLYFPNGLYRLNSGIVGQQWSIIGDEFNGATGTINNLGTRIHYYGVGGWCIDITSAVEISDLTIVSKVSYQSGLRIDNAITARVKNIKLAGFDEVSLAVGKVYTSSTVLNTTVGGGCYFCNFDNIQIQGYTSYSKCALYVQGDLTGNSNTNVFNNLFIYGSFRTYIDCGGNGNEFSGGDIQPTNTPDNPNCVRYWIIFRNNASTFTQCYIEALYAVFQSQPHIERYSPFTFSAPTSHVYFQRLPDDGDTITLGVLWTTTTTRTITFRASGANPALFEVNRGSSIREATENLAAFVNNSTDATLSQINADDYSDQIYFHPTSSKKLSIETTKAVPSFTANATINSKTLSNVSNLTNLYVGQLIQGPLNPNGTAINIPLGTTISAIDVGASTITMSNAAIASGTGITILPQKNFYRSGGGNQTSNGNVISQLNFATSTVNLSATVKDLGIANKWQVARTGWFTPMAAPQKVSTRNLISSADFKCLKSDGIPVSFGTGGGLSSVFYNYASGSSAVVASATLGSAILTNVFWTPGIAVGRRITSAVSSLGQTTMSWGSDRKSSTTITAIDSVAKTITVADAPNSSFTGKFLFSFTANTATGSNVLTNVSTTAGLYAGQAIAGTGIPTGTVISSIDTPNSTVTMSANATANGTAIAVTPSNRGNGTLGTVSGGIGRFQGFNATFTPGVMNVTSTPSGVIVIGATVLNGDPNTFSGVQITAQLTGTPGGTGTYSVTGSVSGSYTLCYTSNPYQVGIYRVVFTSATAFDVYDPTNANIGSGVVGTAFNLAQIGFLITAGATAFVAGDSFSIHKMLQNGSTITRVSSPTPNGAPYSLKATCELGGTCAFTFNPTNAALVPQAKSYNNFRGRTFSCGIWCYSKTPDSASLTMKDGGFPSGGDGQSIVGHSGTGWEFLSVVGRTPYDDALNGQAISVTFAVDAADYLTSDYNIYWGEPVFMFGDQLPEAQQPLLLDDTDAASFGRITYNPPQQLLSSAGANNSTTPDVSQFNLFNEQYTSATNVSQFLNGRAGQEITIFTTTANITFVHNGAATANTIYTKSGSNTSTAANKVYKFSFNGTKWYEV
jgi:hypothetical protein